MDPHMSWSIWARWSSDQSVSFNEIQWRHLCETTAPFWPTLTLKTNTPAASVYSNLNCKYAGFFGSWTLKHVPWSSHFRYGWSWTMGSGTWTPPNPYTGRGLSQNHAPQSCCKYLTIWFDAEIGETCGCIAAWNFDSQLFALVPAPWPQISVL